MNVQGSPGDETVLETRHLRLVQAIADEGGVTRAGDRLHLTQSAVSRQLAELEDRLGLRLFARVRKRLVITPAGTHLLETSRRVLDDLARAEREMKLRGGRAERWPLRLSTACYTCYHWLPPALREFQRRHPDADPCIVLDATPDPIPALLRGELELAVTNAEVRRRELEVVPLFEDEVIAVVGEGHRLAARRHIEGADLDGEALFAFAAGGPDAAWFRRAFLGRAQPRELRAVPITEVMLELVKADLGAAVVHRWIVEPQVRAGAVIALRLGRRGLWKVWKAAFARTSGRRAELLELVALLRGSLRAPGQRRLPGARRAAAAAAEELRAAPARGTAAGGARRAG
ncbi:MAG: LysR substrate-binding domain-containing protein [Thermodesulfobacteriota bacterium]